MSDINVGKITSLMKNKTYMGASIGWQRYCIRVLLGGIKDLLFLIDKLLSFHGNLIPF